MRCMWLGIASLNYIMREFKNGNSCYSFHEWILAFSPAIVKKISIVSPNDVFSRTVSRCFVHSYLKASIGLRSDAL